MKWASGFLFLIVVLLLVLSGCVVPEESPARAPAAPVAFSPEDRQLILDYYQEFEFPPEIADPSIIAPELEERLQATGRVPPGLAAMPLPVNLERQLSSLPPGYQRFRAGSAVILMDIRTLEVIDQVSISGKAAKQGYE